MVINMEHHSSKWCREQESTEYSAILLFISLFFFLLFIVQYSTELYSNCCPVHSFLLFLELFFLYMWVHTCHSECDEGRTTLDMGWESNINKKGKEAREPVEHWHTLLSVSWVYTMGLAAYYCHALMNCSLLDHEPKWTLHPLDCLLHTGIASMPLCGWLNHSFVCENF